MVQLMLLLIIYLISIHELETLYVLDFQNLKDKYGKI